MESDDGLRVAAEQAGCTGADAADVIGFVQWVSVGPVNLGVGWTKGDCRYPEMTPAASGER